MGTHRQLGLAGCGFHQATGVPCMSCGMTTAFAHTARGELLSAVAAQPMGAALALACVAAVVPAMWTALTGHVWLPLFILLTSQRFWFSVLGAWMASWVYKAVAARLSAG
jgi:sugar phosphate permease